MTSPWMLESLAENRRKYWAGQFPPTDSFLTSDRLFSTRNGFRELPANHNFFDTVQLLEYDLGSFPQWKIILLEALRLLRPGKTGVLSLRFRESQWLTVFSLATFIERREDVRVIEFEQVMTQERIFTYNIQIERDTLEMNSSIDICAISDGKRLDNLRRLIDSVSEASAVIGLSTKVLICGPLESLAELETYSDLVTVLDEPSRFRDMGWITRKKNILVEASKATHVLVIHDRYIIDNDFFTNLDAFGWEFDLIVPAQRNLDGSRFPDWVATRSQWRWSQNVLLDPTDFHENLYVNGGAVIARRQVLVEYPWNEMLFWNQGEDVALSRVLAGASIIPAYASSVKLVNLESRPEYTSSFEPAKGADLGIESHRKYPGLMSSLLQSELTGLLVRRLYRSRLSHSKLIKGWLKSRAGSWVAQRLVGHIYSDRGGFS